MHAGIWWINLTERNHLKDLGVDGRIILKRMKTRVSIGWIDLAQDYVQVVMGSFECCTEPLDFPKRRGFLD